MIVTKSRVPTAVLMHGKDLAAALGRGDDVGQLGRVHGHRLLANNVFARFQTGVGQGGVEIVRGSDGHQLDGGILQKGVQAVDGGDARRAQLLHALGADIIDPFDLDHLESGR